MLVDAFDWHVLREKPSKRDPQLVELFSFISTKLRRSEPQQAAETHILFALWPAVTEMSEKLKRFVKTLDDATGPASARILNLKNRKLDRELFVF